LALNNGTIKDAAENSATLTLAAPGESGSLGANNAIVIDTSDPTVAVNNITVNVGSGQVTITTAMIENGSSDNCDSELTYEITTTNTFDCSDVGTVQTGAFRATDNAGNFTEASFEVTIVDTTAPVISLLGESTVTVEWLSSYTDAGATATDTCGGNLTSSIATVNPVDVNTVGSYTVTYNVSDASSNAATQVTRTVNVVDTVAPTLSNVSIASDSSIDTTYATATTDDNVTLTFTASEAIGTPTVTFKSGGDDINDSSVTYTNTSGNTWTAAYTVDSSDTDGAVSYSIAFTDSHSNAGTAVTSGSGSVTIDSTGPTMTITATEVTDGQSTNNSTITLLFTSSEATTNFTSGDVAVTGGTLSEFASVSSTVYTAIFTPSAAGATTINVAAGTFTDRLTNPNVVADEFNWTYDNVVPTMTISSSTVSSGINN
jgi:hypothetical protein